MEKVNSAFLQKLGLMLDAVTCHKLIQAAPSIDWESLEVEFANCMIGGYAGWISACNEQKQRSMGIPLGFRRRIDEFKRALGLTESCPKVSMLATLEEQAFSDHAKECAHCRTLVRTIMWEPFFLDLPHVITFALMKENKALLQLKMPEWEELGSLLRDSTAQNARLKLESINWEKIQAENSLFKEICGVDPVRLNLAACLEMVS